MTEKEIIFCSFCKKSQRDVKKVVNGSHGVNICDECIGVCNEILAEDSANVPSTGFKLDAIRLPTPKAISQKLSETVIGQEHAKKVLSVAVYRHYWRLLQGDKWSSLAPKENILLIGPTGVGKTLLIRQLAAMLEVPVAIADATALTEAGYVGEDVENVLVYLWKAADGDIAATTHGVVYIDEIDKKARKSAANVSITRDVSGEGVQNAILNMLQGGTVRLDVRNKRKTPGSDFIDLDTSRILFICSGAFTGIEALVERRLQAAYARAGETIIYEPDILRQFVGQADLEEFGLIPELAGRFSAIVSLNSLRESDFVRILREPKGAILAEYESLFASQNVSLTVTDDAVAAIAKQAAHEGSGARALKRIVDRCLLDALYEVPGRKNIRECRLDSETVESLRPPTLLDSRGKRVNPERTKVFISYSHQDRSALQEFKTMLAPLIRADTIDVWLDEQIRPDQRWREEIDDALAAAKVAVLLVSPHFLASEFIVTAELPYLLEAAKRDGVKIMWVLLSSCLYQETPLKDIQATHDVSKPLDALAKPKRREVLVTICENVKRATEDKRSNARSKPNSP